MANKPLAKDRAGVVWWVDSRRLIEQEGFNRRENYGDIPKMANEIKAAGVDTLDPLTCFKKGEYYVVLRGHRRRRALKILEESGEIIMVRVLLAPKGFKLEDYIADQISDNEGLRLSVWEQAKVARDLRKLGWSDKDIQEKTGKGLGYIRRLLSLADAPQKLINLVREGRVTGTMAMDMIAEKRVDELVQKAESGTLPTTEPETEQTLFPPEAAAPPPSQKITRSDLRPNSWKVFRKWVPKAEEQEIAPEKSEFFDFLKKMIDGKLTEKDFKKFFK